MVWNRRARKRSGKTNPPEAWVWSSHPTHEAIVSRSMFDAALKVAKGKQGAAPAASRPPRVQDFEELPPAVNGLVPSVPKPDVRQGAPRQPVPLLPARATPRQKGRERASRPPSHRIRARNGPRPRASWLLRRPYLRTEPEELLEEDLRALEGKADRQHRSRIPSLRRAIELIEARQARQVRNLEHDDPRGVLFRRIRDRLEELEQDRLAKLEELRSLEEEEDPGREAQAVELLEGLPVLPEGLSSAPEELLRRLFECFRLNVSYEKPTNLAHVRVSISEDTVEQVLGDGAVLGDGGGEGTNCAALVCAPGGARQSPAQIQPADLRPGLIVMGSFELPRAARVGRPYAPRDARGRFAAS